MTAEETISAVRRWVEAIVIELNLCPFAGREFQQNRIRFSVTPATTEEELLASLKSEVDLLGQDSAIETTLLIHPGVLQEFADYNEFLDQADRLLEVLELRGIFQIASFHPQYQFANSLIDDVENYTNRSPYPMLHLLREESVNRAIESHPDTNLIPERNVALMKKMGSSHVKQLLQHCLIDLNEK
ncbi:MAG: DUF1415 domain-containing protein [Pseudomonadota bacterium]